MSISIASLILSFFISILVGGKLAKFNVMFVVTAYLFRFF